MGLTGVTLVGHDVGGMVAYAYLRAHQDLARAVIMDIVVPGVAPWEEFLRQPFRWHFALHSVRELPELLVQGRQQEYFDYFYTVLSADPAKITGSARRTYAAAYAADSARAAGFSWSVPFPRMPRTTGGPARARTSQRRCSTCGENASAAAISAPMPTGCGPPE